ncbi:hypothetical protein [Streptomyces sp. NPDC001999]
MSDDYIPAPDLTGVPPKRLLPKALHKLYDARDAAWDRFTDFESDHIELLGSAWEAIYAELDERAGREAAAKGADPLSVPSALARARDERPRVRGALRQFAADVRSADIALSAAVRLELAAIGTVVRADVDKAAEAYVEAQAKANELRQQYGAALCGLEWVTNWALLGLRTDFQDVTAAEPRDSSGNPAEDVYGRPVDRGAAEVSVIAESYSRAPGREPLVPVRLKGGTVTDNVKASHAAYLVANGSAESVEGV